MTAENYDLEFIEPYMLAMAANEEGETGSQFFITTAPLTPLNGSQHTIIGRLINGKQTLDIMEGVEEFRMQENANRNLANSPWALGH